MNGISRNKKNIENTTDGFKERKLNAKALKVIVTITKYK